MRRRRVLYITGSIGLGHVTRDLAVAREVRRLHPDIELRWLGSETFQPLLKQAGEELLSEASHLAEINLSDSRVWRLPSALIEDAPNIVINRVCRGNRFRT
jgi:hypothetical protein